MDNPANTNDSVSENNAENLDVSVDHGSIDPNATVDDNQTDNNEPDGSEAGGEADPDGTGQPPDGNGTDSDKAGLMFGDEPLPDFVPKIEDPEVVKMRQELEQLKRGQAIQSQQQLLAEPQKPDRLQFDSDDDYETAFEEYVTEKGRWKNQVESRKRASEEHERQFKEAVEHYSSSEKRTEALKLEHFEAAEKHADLNLNPGIVGAILFGGKDGTFPNPQNMMYAIGRHPELLKKLNEADNPFLVGAMLHDISRKANFAPKAPTKPVNAIPNVNGGGVSDLHTQLEAAEKEADITGDRTRVIELQSQIDSAKK